MTSHIRVLFQKSFYSLATSCLHIAPTRVLKKFLEKIDRLLTYVKCYKLKAPYYIYRVYFKKEGVWYAIAKAKRMFRDFEWGYWWIKIWGRRIEAGKPKILEDILLVILYEAIRYYRFKYKHDVVLDIGAFAGETAIWFIVSGQAKRVIAIEPVPIFAYLAMINTRGLPIDVLNLAVSKPGVSEVTVVTNNDRPMDSKITHSKTGTVKVKAVDLAHLITSYNPGGIKMDCEGCEEAILYTPCTVLKRVREIIAELHVEYANVNAIREKMRECGFQEEVLAEFKDAIIVRWWR